VEKGRVVGETEVERCGDEMKRSFPNSAMFPSRNVGVEMMKSDDAIPRSMKIPPPFPLHPAFHGAVHDANEHPDILHSTSLGIWLNTAPPPLSFSLTEHDKKFTSRISTFTPDPLPAQILTLDPFPSDREMDEKLLFVTFTLAHSTQVNTELSALSEIDEKYVSFITTFPPLLTTINPPLSVRFTFDTTQESRVIMLFGPVIERNGSDEKVRDEETSKELSFNDPPFLTEMNE